MAEPGTTQIAKETGASPQQIRVGLNDLRQTTLRERAFTERQKPSGVPDPPVIEVDVVQFQLSGSPESITGEASTDFNDQGSDGGNQRQAEESVGNSEATPDSCGAEDYYTLGDTEFIIPANTLWQPYVEAADALAGYIADARALCVAKNVLDQIIDERQIGNETAEPAECSGSLNLRLSDGYEIPPDSLYQPKDTEGGPTIANSLAGYIADLSVVCVTKSRFADAVNVVLEGNDAKYGNSCSGAYTSLSPGVQVSANTVFQGTKEKSNALAQYIADLSRVCVKNTDLANAINPIINTFIETYISLEITCNEDGTITGELINSYGDP